MDDDHSSKSHATEPRARIVATLLIAIFFGLTYGFRPDGLQAIHWWPISLWTPVSLLPWASVRPWRYAKAIGISLCGWLVLVLIQSELPVNIPRPKDSSTALVVALNCAGGSEAAAQEAFSVGADLVLLQEVGSRDEFVSLGSANGYEHVAWSLDDAIFSRSPLTDVASERDFVAGTWHFSGRKIRVVSLRLHPPEFRLDLWYPSCWGAYAEDTQQRRRRFAEIVREVSLEGRWIAGGDFNATNPRIVRDTMPEGEEAMRTSGTTWIGTGTNDFPFAPVDQIWSNLGWVQAAVRKTEHSDHRMVVAETRPSY